MYDFKVDTATTPKARLILAHGAGAGMSSDFMVKMASLLNKQNIEVVRFNFPYMQTMQRTGKRRPPEKMQALISYYNELFTHLNDTLPSLPTFIGGKSMGGRVASHILETTDARGAVALGYPFHPAGKPESLRTVHLQHLVKPMLILQGSRDTLGSEEEIWGYPLSSKIVVRFLVDGDHSLKPRKSSGVTHAHNMQQAATQTAKFMTTEYI